VPPYVAFFSELFTANPDRIPQWRLLIDKQDDQTKHLLEKALSLSKAGGVLSLQGHSGALNDMYWGAYFASGNERYLQKLVDQLQYYDERNDINLFLVGATAKWSLASNSKSHATVRRYLDVKLDVDKRTRQLIDQLIAEDPARAREEIRDIIAKQRQAGKWITAQ
jgi:hypothetical protein